MLRLGRRRELGVARGFISIDLNDWEVGEVESLSSKLHPLTIRRGVDDLLRQRENKNGTFSVKSFYSSLSRAIRPPFPARIIWTP